LRIFVTITHQAYGKITHKEKILSRTSRTSELKNTLLES